MTFSLCLTSRSRVVARVCLPPTFRIFLKHVTKFPRIFVLVRSFERSCVAAFALSLAGCSAIGAARECERYCRDMDMVCGGVVDRSGGRHPPTSSFHVGRFDISQNETRGQSFECKSTTK